MAALERLSDGNLTVAGTDWAVTVRYTANYAAVSVRNASAVDAAGNPCVASNVVERTFDGHVARGIVARCCSDLQGLRRLGTGPAGVALRLVVGHPPRFHRVGPRRMVSA